MSSAQEFMNALMATVPPPTLDEGGLFGDQDASSMDGVVVKKENMGFWMDTGAAPMAGSGFTCTPRMIVPPPHPMGAAVPLDVKPLPASVAIHTKKKRRNEARLTENATDRPVDLSLFIQAPRPCDSQECGGRGKFIPRLFDVLRRGVHECGWVEDMYRGRTPPCSNYPPNCLQIDCDKLCEHFSWAVGTAQTHFRNFGFRKIIYVTLHGHRVCWYHHDGGFFRPDATADDLTQIIRHRKKKETSARNRQAAARGGMSGMGVPCECGAGDMIAQVIERPLHMFVEQGLVQLVIPAPRVFFSGDTKMVFSVGRVLPQFYIDCQLQFMLGGRCITSPVMGLGREQCYARSPPVCALLGRVPVGEIDDGVLAEVTILCRGFMITPGVPVSFHPDQVRETSLPIGRRARKQRRVCESSASESDDEVSLTALGLLMRKKDSLSSYLTNDNFSI